MCLPREKDTDGLPSRTLVHAVKTRVLLAAKIVGRETAEEIPETSAGTESLQWERFL